MSFTKLLGGEFDVQAAAPFTVTLGGEFDVDPTRFTLALGGEFDVDPAALFTAGLSGSFAVALPAEAGPVLAGTCDVAAYRGGAGGRFGRRRRTR